MMKFKECREFAEAISEALKKLMDDEWDSGRWKKKSKKLPIYPSKEGKQKSWKTVYHSDYFPFLEKY